MVEPAIIDSSKSPDVPNERFLQPGCWEINDFCKFIILFIVSILAFLEVLILGINIKPSSIKFG